MVIERDHPVAGKVPLVANPIKLSESIVEPGSAPPLLGENTDQILAELLGIDQVECRQLRDRGIL